MLVAFIKGSESWGVSKEERRVVEEIFGDARSASKGICCFRKDCFLASERSSDMVYELFRSKRSPNLIVTPFNNFINHKYIMSAYPEGDTAYGSQFAPDDDYNTDDAIKRMIGSARVLKQVFHLYFVFISHNFSDPS